MTQQINWPDVIKNLKKNGRQSLNPPGTHEEIHEYFNIPRNQLEKLHPVDCAEISIRISQFSLYIKRVCNRNKAKINWIESQIDKMICQDVKNYRGQWKYQINEAILNNDVASQLKSIQIELQKQFDEYDGLYFQLQNLADHFKNLQFAKLQELKNG